MLIKQSTIYDRNNRYGNIWKEVWIRDGGICQLCNSKLDICIDHIIPIKRNGKSALGNMRLLCRSCNSKEKIMNLKQDRENKRNRKDIAKFREKNTDYFKNKYKEFIATHPGYMTKYSIEYRKLYQLAK